MQGVRGCESGNGSFGNEILMSFRNDDYWGLSFLRIIFVIL